MLKPTDDMRSVMVNLLKEVPADTVLWRLSSPGKYTYTAGEIAQLIEQGDPLGNEYATECLRVARDLIMRQVKRVEERTSIIDALSPTEELPAVKPFKL